MANSFQVRASVNAWLGPLLPIAAGLSGDRVAYQANQGHSANEWRITWDGEREGEIDQGFSRLIQVDRFRTDGDEIALEKELVAALIATGLFRPGDSASVSINNYPSATSTQIGRARVSRLNDVGWRYLPDPQNRPDHLWAVISLRVAYGS